MIWKFPGKHFNKGILMDITIVGCVCGVPLNLDISTAINSAHCLEVCPGVIGLAVTYRANIRGVIVTSAIYSPRPMCFAHLCFFRSVLQLQ